MWVSAAQAAAHALLASYVPRPQQHWSARGCWLLDYKAKRRRNSFQELTESATKIYPKVTPKRTPSHGYLGLQLSQLRAFWPPRPSLGCHALNPASVTALTVVNYVRLQPEFISWYRKPVNGQLRRQTPVEENKDFLLYILDKRCRPAKGWPKDPYLVPE